MPKPRRRPFIRKLRPVPTDCRFCKSEEELSYKNWKVLSQFLTERGKILGKDRSGICAKHQRHLAREIKRARHLALLPFVVKPLWEDLILPKRRVSAEILGNISVAWFTFGVIAPVFTRPKEPLDFFSNFMLGLIMSLFFGGISLWLVRKR